MITAVEIANFKGIRERMRVGLGPVTLLFGPNSAGKSSLLHAFHLAREILVRRNLNVDRTELGDEFIDLGGFLQFVHGRDPGSVITLRFELDFGSVDFLNEYPIDEFLIPLSANSDDSLDVSSLGDDIMSGWVEIKLGWSHEERRTWVQEYSVGYENEPLASISSQRESTSTCSIRNLNLEHALFRWPGITSVDEIGAFGIIDQLYPFVQSSSQAAYLEGNPVSAEELATAASHEVVRFAGMEGFPAERHYRSIELSDSGSSRRLVLYREHSGSRVRVHSVHDALPEGSAPFSIEAVTQSLDALLKVAQAQFDEAETPLVRILEQDGALPAFDRSLTLLLENVESESEQEGYELESLSPDGREKVRRLLNRVPSRQHVFQQLLNRLLLVPGRVLARSLSEFRYIGPVREAIPRNFEPFRYPEARRWAGGLAAWEELLRHPADLCPAVSDWMSDEERLDTGYGVRVDEYREISTLEPLWLDLLSGRLLDSYDPDDIRKLAERIPTKRRVVLYSTDSPQTHLPQDVGQGITQAVPVLVAALSPVTNVDRSQSGLVAIEQPELHLNPRQQAALGDVFLHAALASPKNRIILETHSEHLILRIQRRIRESSRGKPWNGLAIKGDRVTVYHVSSEEGCTRFRRLQLDKKGEFLEPWPDDFFELDFHERFA